MAKKNSPVIITANDVENKTLLTVALRNVASKVAVLEDNHDALKTQVDALPTPATSIQTKATLEATGAHPLNIQDLHGVAGEPQLAMLPVIAKPTGLALQQLENGHIFAVKSGAAYQMWMVIGGNPNTLFQLI